MFKVGEMVKYNVGSKVNPNYIEATVREIYPNGSFELNNGHTFNSEGVHYDWDSQMMNRDGERVKLEKLTCSECSYAKQDFVGDMYPEFHCEKQNSIDIIKLDFQGYPSNEEGCNVE